MCSELFRIPMQLGGVNLFGFGVLLVLWLGGAGVWLYYQRRAGMPAADAWGFAPAVGVVAVLIAVLPSMFPLGVPIRGYGVMLLLASVSGIALAVHRAQQNRLHPDVIFSLAIWLFVSGILGARVFFIVEYWETRFAPLPLNQALLEMLMFTEGGLVVYGSLIGASIAFVAYCRRHRLPVLAMADILAPSLVIGLALGRVGCLLNGCCYGGPCDKPWAVSFPIGSPAYQEQLISGDVQGVLLLEDNAEGRSRVVLEGAGVPGKPGSDTVLSINGQEVRSAVEAQVRLTRVSIGAETIDEVPTRPVAKGDRVLWVTEKEEETGGNAGGE